MIRDTDIAYLAGLFDGEGSIEFTKRKDGTKYLMQYRWRCTFRDAFYVCCLLFPYAHTKLPKIQQIIAHYSKMKLKEDNVINLEEYKVMKGKIN